MKAYLVLDVDGTSYTGAHTKVGVALDRAVADRAAEAVKKRDSWHSGAVVELDLIVEEVPRAMKPGTVFLGRVKGQHIVRTIVATEGLYLDTVTRINIDPTDIDPESIRHITEPIPLREPRSW